MGWETRRGRLYYYRKRRIDGRVVSEYIGDGPYAHQMASPKRRPPRDDAFDELDQLIEANEGKIKTLVAAAYVAGGYHQHKGQWRIKRTPRS